MKTITQSIVISRPVEEVFAFTIDPANTPKWVDSVIEECTKEWPVKLGTVYRSKSRSGEWSELTLTVFEPNKAFVMRMTDGSEVRYAFTKIDAASTQLDYVWASNGHPDAGFLDKILTKLKAILETKPHMLRVFVDANDEFGDPASVILDEGRLIPDGERQELARILATGETIFVNELNSAKISVMHSQGEIGFAGVGVLGAAWLLAKLRDNSIDRMYTRDGEIKVWYEDGITWARAGLSIMPPWNYRQLDSPEIVEAITVDEMRDVEHTMVWAWVDEAKGLIRARTFAADWEIPEAQGNGSGAMVLAAKLNRGIEIKHGEGSVIFAKPAGSGQADIGGRVVDDGVAGIAPARKRVRDIVSAIVPFDELESQHRRDALDWMDSGAPLFRIERPDKPPKHLVSYIVPYDEARNSIMLIDHAKAKAWLPPGGHVEIGEDPKIAALREAKEELNIDAAFSRACGDVPLFITVTTTKGHGEHTDVSLWYVIQGDSSTDMHYTDTEGDGAHQWLTLDEILARDIATLDPHMHRFTRKLQAKSGRRNCD